MRLEIASALKQGKLVIPVLVGRAAMPPPDELPDDLKDSGAAQCEWNSVTSDFAYDVEKLIQASSRRLFR